MCNLCTIFKSLDARHNTCYLIFRAEETTDGHSIFIHIHRIGEVLGIEGDILENINHFLDLGDDVGPMAHTLGQESNLDDSRDLAFLLKGTFGRIEVMGLLGVRRLSPRSWVCTKPFYVNFSFFERLRNIACSDLAAKMMAAASG